MQWILELSQRKQDNEWENSRMVGETPEKLQSLLKDLSDFVPIYSQKALAMETPVFLKAVLRVERNVKENSLGLSGAPSTSKRAAEK